MNKQLGALQQPCMHYLFYIQKDVFKQYYKFSSHILNQQILLIYNNISLVRVLQITNFETLLMKPDIEVKLNEYRMILCHLIYGDQRRDYYIYVRTSPRYHNRKLYLHKRIYQQVKLRKMGQDVISKLNRDDIKSTKTVLKLQKRLE